MKRSERKTETRRKIVNAAARRFLTDGLEGATIANVLGDAGLTHGTFYTHFQTKETMLEEAFVAAAAETSDRWIKGVADVSTVQGIVLLLGRALGRAHLRHPETGCPFVAAGAEVWRGTPGMRKAYQEGMLAVAHKVSESLCDTDGIDRALAIHAICTGGLTMARSCASEEVALRVLRACRQFVIERTTHTPSARVADQATS